MGVMNIKRRTFLSGAIAAAVASAGAGGVAAVAEEHKSAGRGQVDDFPILLMELCGKYPGEEGPDVVTHLTSRRMVSVDLENDDDWGDLNTFWDGEEMAWGLGNDVDGYWKIVRVFELVEPQIEMHEDKFPMAYELTFDQLVELMDARIARWG